MTTIFLIIAILGILLVAIGAIIDMVIYYKIYRRRNNGKEEEKR